MIHTHGSRGMNPKDHHFINGPVCAIPGMIKNRGKVIITIGMLKKGICEPIVRQIAIRKIILYFRTTIVEDIIRAIHEVV